VAPVSRARFQADAGRSWRYPKATPAHEEKGSEQQVAKWNAKLRARSIHRKLTTDHGGAGMEAVVDDFEQIGTVLS
jgi:hypothetical protein